MKKCCVGPLNVFGRQNSCNELTNSLIRVNTLLEKWAKQRKLMMDIFGEFTIKARCCWKMLLR